MSAVPRSRAALAGALLATAFVGVAAAAGFLATTGYLWMVVAAVVGIAVLIQLLQSLGQGAWFALLVLGALDSLPGPTLERAQGLYGFNVTDMIIATLIVSLLIDNATDGFRRIRGNRLGPVLLLWSACFLALWVVTVIRSDLADGVSIRIGGSYGRDFLYYSLLVPLMVGSLTRKRVRSSFLIVVGAAAMLVATGQIFVSLGGGHLEFIVHLNRTRLETNLTRVYSPANDLIAAALPVSVGYLLLHRAGPQRRLAGLCATLTALAVALQLTRALYLGEIAGLAAALTAWLLVDLRVARKARRRLAVAIAIAGLAVAGVAIYHPRTGAGSPLNTVATRFSSFFSAVGSSDTSKSTIAYRERLDGILESKIGDQWLFGLGFLSPKVHYYPELPNGSIRNSDTGVMNAVVTMGVVGAALVYVPVITVGVMLMWTRLVRKRETDAWIAFGTFGWCVLVLSTSGSLVTLFSPSGLVLSAAMLALGTSSLPEVSRRTV